MQCTAHNRQGNPCGNHAIPYHTVCRYHGGAAPQVKRIAARRELEQLLGPALTRLKGIIDNQKTPPAVLLAAIKDILDRTGYKPVEQVEVFTIDNVQAEINRLLDEEAAYGE